MNIQIERKLNEIRTHTHTLHEFAHTTFRMVPPCLRRQLRWWWRQSLLKSIYQIAYRCLFPTECVTVWNAREQTITHRIKASICTTFNIRRKFDDKENKNSNRLKLRLFFFITTLIHIVFLYCAYATKISRGVVLSSTKSTLKIL